MSTLCNPLIGKHIIHASDGGERIVRFLVDESTGPIVARWLREQGHDVFSVFEQARGAQDAEILLQAFSENRILVTNDKDFGEKVFRERQPHRGIILLRLEDERAPVKVETLNHLLANHSERLADNYVVVTETRVRFAQK